MPRDSILVDMTSSQPTLAIEIAKAAEERGVRALDAPVSGGDIGAREARLSIMVGGDRQSFDDLMPLWSLMGKTIEHHGPPGSGQHCKLTNQILVGGIMVSMCEALIYARRSGANLEAVLTSVLLRGCGKLVVVEFSAADFAGRFATGFYVEHFVKDLGIAIDECKRMNLDLPV